MRLNSALLLCLALGAATLARVAFGEDPVPPAATSTAVTADASAPSLSLQPLVDTYLGPILAPLDEPAVGGTEVVVHLKATFADALASASPARKPAFQAALAVCDSLAGAMAERRTAAAALRGALTTRSSEAQQPNGGAEAVEKARAADAFFTGSQKNAWVQRAEILRQRILAQVLRERETEHQAEPWSAATPAPPVVMVAAIPPVAASADPPAGKDPLLGSWLLPAGDTINIKEGNVVEGGNDSHGEGGTWQYFPKGTLSRYYEIHWTYRHRADYFTLSRDGKTLSGKHKNGAPFSAVRQ